LTQPRRPLDKTRRDDTHVGGGGEEEAGPLAEPLEGAEGHCATPLPLRGRRPLQTLRGAARRRRSGALGEERLKLAADLASSGRRAALPLEADIPVRGDRFITHAQACARLPTPPLSSRGSHSRPHTHACRLAVPLTWAWAWGMAPVMRTRPDGRRRNPGARESRQQQQRREHRSDGRRTVEARDLREGG